jgi:hypothetical protein
MLQLTVDSCVITDHDQIHFGCRSAERGKLGAHPGSDLTIILRKLKTVFAGAQLLLQGTIALRRPTWKAEGLTFNPSVAELWSFGTDNNHAIITDKLVCVAICN